MLYIKLFRDFWENILPDNGKISRHGNLYRQSATEIDRPATGIYKETLDVENPTTDFNHLAVESDHPARKIWFPACRLYSIDMILYLLTEPIDKMNDKYYIKHWGVKWKH